MTELAHRLLSFSLALLLSTAFLLAENNGVKVPDSLPAGDVALTLQAGGVSSSSKVSLNIQAAQ